MNNFDFSIGNKFESYLQISNLIQKYNLENNLTLIKTNCVKFDSLKKMSNYHFNNSQIVNKLVYYKLKY